MRRLLLAMGGVLLCALVVSTASIAVDKPEIRKPARPQKPVLPEFTAEREADALRFVRNHHTELADLLEQLKGMNLPQYQRAIRELYQASELLAAARLRDPERYKLDLEAWQWKSRVELLAARLASSRDPSMEKDLRRLLGKQVDVQLAQQYLERDRLRQKLEKVETQIRRLESDRDKTIENRFRKLIRVKPSRL